MEQAYGNWILVITLSGLFLWFVYDAFKPKTGIDWRLFGAFSAFIIALFTEMYGFPLTIYLLSSWFGNRFPQINFSHNSGHLWEDLLGNTGDPHFSILHILSYGLIIGGLILISVSWKILYQATKRHTIAMSGPYKYIRHPQYVGFVIIILGFLMQWPTLPTLIMAPVLTVMYIRLARKEEREVLRKYPQYQYYLKNTPSFLPSIKFLKAVLIGLLGMAILLGFYFIILTLVSGWVFAKQQFFTYWYFIILLSLGFGIQIGLYTYLRNNINSQKQSGLSAEVPLSGTKAGKVVAVSGTTSTLAMISCCSHYLVNLLPVLGAVGFITIISQYQIQLFWIGIIANIMGGLYMGSKVWKVRNQISKSKW